MNEQSQTLQAVIEKPGNVALNFRPSAPTPICAGP